MSSLGETPKDRILYLTIASSGDRHRTLGATDVFYVILNGQQHSAHFSKEEADSVAFDLSVEHNYEGHPEECGYAEISVLSLREMMESSVEMVI